MLRGRPALASVFLCFICVFTQKSHQAPTPCSQDMISRVKELIKEAPNMKWLESKLYTPTSMDYKQNCTSSALACFAAETTVLLEEWKNVKKEFNHSKLDKMLTLLAERVRKTESNCRQCELHKEENAEKFLSNLLLILQFVNSQFCTSARTS